MMWNVVVNCMAIADSRPAMWTATANYIVVADLRPTLWTVMANLRISRCVNKARRNE